MISDSSFNHKGAGWLMRAVTAGFLATLLVACVFVLAYWIATWIGSNNPQASVLLRWAWALTHNTVTSQAGTALPLTVVLHFLGGMAWAIVYAILFETRLGGPAWRRGLTFAFVPWIFSIAVLLPLLGAGFLGFGLGAGPLPLLGNLVINLVYGAALGELYLPESDLPLGEREGNDAPEIAALAHAGQTMAIGIFAGLLVGALIGSAVGTFLGLGPVLTIVYGAIMGSAIGALVGAFWGLSPQAG